MNCAPPTVVVAQARVVAALISARESTADVLEPLTMRLQALGAVVVGELVQRRGVSRGGVASMTRPLSASTLLGAGKATELAAMCRERGAAVVVFANALSGTQVRTLEERTQCRVIEAAWLTAPDESGS